MNRRRRAPGDPDAARRARYEAAFLEVYEPLQRYLRRRADPATAEDVLGEALTVLWRRLDDVPPDAVLPWCYGTARRCLANHRRGDARAERLVARVGAEPAAAPPADGLDGDPVLDAALERLDRDDREILRLWAWEELAPREIAEVLGISANAASIRLHRAKRRLREEIDGKETAGGGQERGGDTLAARKEER